MSVKLIHFGSKLIGVAFSVNGRLITTADVAIAAELKVELIDRVANVAVLLSDEVISDFEFALLKEIEAITVVSNQNLKCELNCLSWGSPRAKCEAILATTDDSPLSGSPMINAKGEVVGMASFHIENSGNICGYVPSPIIDMVMKLAVKSWFGGVFIEYGTLLSAKLSEGKIQPYGYIVFKLEPKGPLENAGVTRGSILLKVNDRKFHPSSCMFRHRPGETVKCNFYGGGVFNIALASYPEQEECSQGSVSGFKKLTEVVREVKVKLPSYPKEAVIELTIVDDDNSAIEVQGFAIRTKSESRSDSDASESFAISSTETIIHSKYISEGSQVYYRVGSSVLVAEIVKTEDDIAVLSIPSVEYFERSQTEGMFIIRSATGELVPASMKVDGALIDSDGKLVRLIDSSETPKPVELLDFPLNFNY